MQCRLFPKGIFAALLAAAILAPGASAEPDQDGAAPKKDKRQGDLAERAAFRAEVFRAADKDADGALSAEEFAELPAAMSALRRQRAFERLDADGDGRLMPEELAPAAKQRRSAKQRKQRGPAKQRKPDAGRTWGGRGGALKGR